MAKIFGVIHKPTGRLAATQFHNRPAGQSALMNSLRPTEQTELQKRGRSNPTRSNPTRKESSLELCVRWPWWVNRLWLYFCIFMLSHYWLSLLVCLFHHHLSLWFDCLLKPHVFPCPIQNTVQHPVPVFSKPLFHVFLFGINLVFDCSLQCPFQPFLLIVWRLMFLSWFVFLSCLHCTCIPPHHSPCPSQIDIESTD